MHMTQAGPFSTIAAMGAPVGTAIGRHMETAFRLMGQGGCVANESKFWRVLTGEAHPLGNLALLSTPADLATVSVAVEPLIAEAVPAAVVFPGMEVPADVGAYLVERGFAQHGVLPAMAVDIAGVRETSLPAGYELTRVGAADRDEWTRQFANGYELPLGVAQCFAPSDSAEEELPVQFFAVRKNSAIVGTSVCCLKDGVAGIYCVSTIASERGKGLGGHATAEPLRLAARLGYGVGVLQSSEAGYSVYKQLGFRDFGGVPIYVRMP
jgi:hypothetical protein